MKKTGKSPVEDSVKYIMSSPVSFSFSGSFGQKEKTISDFKPERIVYNGLTTIVFFKDGSKEIVRCNDNDVYDEETAVAKAIAHKMFGSKHQFKKFAKNGYRSMTLEEEAGRRMVKSQKRLDKE